MLPVMWRDSKYAGLNTRVGSAPTFGTISNIKAYEAGSIHKKGADLSVP